ncbi:hypothetical protein [Actinomadura sp. 6N118]|uniref:hypothetical protein n=1 Tax=Actinomadura sp. 6N118 TaxID=3375151 RepID=UPI003796BFD7
MSVPVAIAVLLSRGAGAGVGQHAERGVMVPNRISTAFEESRITSNSPIQTLPQSLKEDSTRKEVCMSLLRKVLAATVASSALVLAIPGAGTAAQAQKPAAPAIARTTPAAAPISTSVAPKVKTMKLRKLYDYRLTVGYCVPSHSCDQFRVAKKHPSKAMKKLKSCFNCTFPVSGAPKKYPKKGQKLPLKACWFKKVCNAPVKFYPKGKYGWYFVAQKGHFDGKGSKVHFHWYQKKKVLYLRVWAYVANPSVPDSANKAGAHEAWSQFAKNMARSLT